MKVVSLNSKLGDDANYIKEFTKDFTEGDMFVILHQHKTGNTVRYLSRNVTVAEVNFLLCQAQKHLFEGCFDTPE